MINLNASDAQIQRLYRSVILATIWEACGKFIYPTTEKREDRMIAARDWLTDMSRDFVEVCTLADLDPQYVADNAQRVIEAHDRGQLNLSHMRRNHVGRRRRKATDEAKAA